MYAKEHVHNGLSISPLQPRSMAGYTQSLGQCHCRMYWRSTEGGKLAHSHQQPDNENIDFRMLCFHGLATNYKIIITK